MHRTTIMLPPELKAQAARTARRRGMSLGELVREALEASLTHQAHGADVADDTFWADDQVCEAEIPQDLSADHDRYMYDEP